jgi:hypothetical protein
MTDTAPAGLFTTPEASRGWATVLCLWRLCGKAACRRALRCRGDGNTCFQLNFPLLPADVQDWLAELDELNAQGVAFEQAMADLDARPSGQAFRAWRQAVSESLALPPVEAE